MGGCVHVGFSAQPLQPQGAADPVAPSFSSHALASVDAWREVHRPDVLNRMQRVMGKLPEASKRCDLDVRMDDEVDCGSYVRRLISYQSEHGSRVPAYLLIPKKALRGEHKAFGVLALHQTHNLGHKVVAGLGNSPNDEYGVELAERGYTCIAPAYPLLANFSPDLESLGYSSGTMKAIWDNIRALDLLESLPFVEKGRFASIGHSLGGHNGLFTAAFDERIKIVISSCGMDSFRDYMNGDIRGWTSSRYMPRLLNYKLEAIPFGFHDVLAAIAPRRVFINAPKGDSNFGWESVDRVAKAARPVFELHGAGKNLMVIHPEAGHIFPPEIRREAYELIDKALAAKRTAL